MGRVELSREEVVSRSGEREVCEKVAGVQHENDNATLFG